MACRFPGGARRRRRTGRCCATASTRSPRSPRRAGTRPRAPGSRRPPRKAARAPAGLVDGLDRFDPKFFGISPREAATMDPQQRLLLEVAWEALEDAGHPPDRLAGSATGVFVGIATGDYAHLRQPWRPAALDAYTRHRQRAQHRRRPHLLPARASAARAMAVDTACSSSLVAVHLACQSLRTRRVRARARRRRQPHPVAPIHFVIFSQLRACWRRTAAARRSTRAADGFVRGEGCGVVVLKRLSDALRDGDRDPRGHPRLGGQPGRPRAAASPRRTAWRRRR